MLRILIANQKGGTGKTTTAVALAHGLSLRGFTTVLVDLDVQGNASACLGLDPSQGLYDLLTDRRSLDEVLVEARDRLWFIPSNTKTADLKRSINERSFREEVLVEYLEPLEADYLILDTGPNRDIIHDNAHMVADSVIIPAAVDHLALIGVYQEFETLKTFRGRRQHDIEVTAILPTFFDRVTNESTTMLNTLIDEFGDLVTPAIPRTVRLREAPAFGKTIWEYICNQHEAKDSYNKLIERVIFYGTQAANSA